MKQETSAKGKIFPLMHRQIMMIKGWLRGTHHHCEHLQKYLDEFCYRFNRLKHPDTLFHSLIERMVFHQPLFYQNLQWAYMPYYIQFIFCQTYQHQINKFKEQKIIKNRNSISLHNFNRLINCYYINC